MSHRAASQKKTPDRPDSDAVASRSLPPRAAFSLPCPRHSGAPTSSGDEAVAGGNPDAETRAKAYALLARCRTALEAARAGIADIPAAICSVNWIDQLLKRISGYERYLAHPLSTPGDVLGMLGPNGYGPAIATACRMANRRASFEEAPVRAPMLERYWSDPDYRAALDDETQVNRDRANAKIDEGMRRAREQREAEREANQGDTL